MDWSQRRKIIYALSLAGIIILLAAYPVYKLTSKPPTCFDNKKNGTETGVDCGGICSLMCNSDIKQPRAIWAKAFPTDARTYDLAAYIENPNTAAGVKSARYSLRVLDSSGAVLVEKKGTTELAPASRVLLFEAGVVIDGTPSSVEISFEASDLSKWYKATQALSPVVTKNQNLKDVDTKPRFDATVVNTDPVNDITNLTLNAIIYDTSRNPVAVSKTFIDNIPRGGQQDVFFTWPSKFTKHARGEMCTVPLDTMIVIDHSEDMNIGNKVPAEPLNSIKNSAVTYTGFLGSSDKIGIVSFFDVASSSLDAMLSSDFAAVNTAISNISTSTLKKGVAQNPNLGDALSLAVSELQGERHSADSKQAIITFTSGNSTRPLDPADPKNSLFAQNYAANIASDARRSGINIFAVGLGKNVNQVFLKNQIGGDAAHYFSTSTPDVLQTIYNTASEVMCPTENFITEIVITPRAIFTE